MARRAVDRLRSRNQRMARTSPAPTIKMYVVMFIRKSLCQFPQIQSSNPRPAHQDECHARSKTSHGNAGVWKAWKAIKPAFHPSPTPWKSLRGFPHYHGDGDDYHAFEDRQSPPKPAIRATLTARGL